jgi:hypothetical protein
VTPGVKLSSDVIDADDMEARTTTDKPGNTQAW